MIRAMTLLWGTLALVVGVALFLVKFEVQSLEDDLAGYNREIRKNREETHILRAEWAYLNNPRRLAELNTKFLGLEPLEGVSMVAMASLPMRQRTAPLGPVLAGAGQNVPWISYPFPKPEAQTAVAAPELASRVTP